MAEHEDPSFREARLTPAQEARLAQARLLDDQRVRTFWAQLSTAERNTVHDPSGAVGHRYPLSVNELAMLTGLDGERIETLARSGVVPSWQLEGRELRFEAAGLIVAFALAGSSD
jgi:hypothetical protein